MKRQWIVLLAGLLPALACGKKEKAHPASPPVAAAPKPAEPAAPATPPPAAKPEPPPPPPPPPAPTDEAGLSKVEAKAEADHADRLKKEQDLVKKHQGLID